MGARRLSAREVALPRFELPPDDGEGEIKAFDLASHRRAREALETGLGIPDVGFNVFVVAEDRTGRMSATLDFLRHYVGGLPPPSDWVYLNNFRHPNEPRPLRLPAGQARVLRRRMNDFVHAACEAFAGARLSPSAPWSARLEAAERIVTPLCDELDREFGGGARIGRWLDELRVDAVERHEHFLDTEAGRAAREEHPLEDRYGVNVLVDHDPDDRPPVVLEPHPTYENLFGYSEYRTLGGVLETDFLMIHAGALHRASGGILVLRAEALIREGEVWTYLIGALRDREIRIEELHRQGGVPMAGAPHPHPIPLELKVVIVGAPRWYHDFHSRERDFHTYFKVKADIDEEMPATPRNLADYARLVRGLARRHHREGCEDAAVRYLLGLAGRWAQYRDKLSTRFELLEDVLAEAAYLARGERRPLTERDVQRATGEHRRRNSHMEERAQEHILRGTVLIDTEGAVVGQINALTVRDMGDHVYAAPVRVTARAGVGAHGVINIERMAELGGPLQQKGVYTLEGFLRGRFAADYPLSCAVSVTFEQAYGGVEGDSASLAELIAILSALAELPVRQDLAITGSVNQLGQVQSVGEVCKKVECFFATCAARRLTGTQGVIVPAVNEIELALRDDVTAAIAEERFSVLSVRSVDDAIGLLLGVEPAAVDRRVAARLEAWDRALAERRAF